MLVSPHRVLIAILMVVGSAWGTSAIASDYPRQHAFFGDLHVHTQLSYDAFIFGTRTRPNDAYRFAQGEPIEHPAGFTMKLDRPLDFLAVADHSEYLGVLPTIAGATNPVDHPLADVVRSIESLTQRRHAFEAIRPYLTGEDELAGYKDIVRSAWQDVIRAAEDHNSPGKFTTFIGYEYTTSDDAGGGLHRNVIFGSSKVAPVPFSRLNSDNPEDLWDWMDQQRDLGRPVMAIPHNSNTSSGAMFERTNRAGDPIDADYASQRSRNEPLVEVAQIKGASETHPMLSPNDEWADYEIFPVRLASGRGLKSEPRGSYVRDAYRRGIQIEAATGVNPYNFGLIGSSDTHVSAASYREPDSWGKVGASLESTPASRGSVPFDTSPGATERYANTYYRWWGSAALMGVWAEKNTRESIFAAMRRKETFATSGPRIRVRFFAGYDLSTKLEEVGLSRIYAHGVPMGGELVGKEGASALDFLVQAVRDPQAAPLQRIQVVKGWVDRDGATHERVYDVACSDGLHVNAETNRCPDNGAEVHASDCSTSTAVGASELSTIWRDPDFDPGQRAFYYLRAVQNPTCRWSTWDALRAGVPPRKDLPTTLQERAWSSPIWYRPRD